MTDSQTNYVFYLMKFDSSHQKGEQKENTYRNSH